MRTTPTNNAKKSRITPQTPPRSRPSSPENVRESFPTCGCIYTLRSRQILYANLHHTSPRFPYDTEATMWISLCIEILIYLALLWSNLGGTWVGHSLLNFGLNWLRQVNKFLWPFILPRRLNFFVSQYQSVVERRRNTSSIYRNFFVMRFSDLLLMSYHQFIAF